MFSKVIVLAYIPISNVGGFHPHQSLLVVVFLMMAILTSVKWNLSVVLICISFMARNGEHFFMCFLDIWISSLEKVLFS
jgi:general stress protein CsbA